MPNWAGDGLLQGGLGSLELVEEVLRGADAVQCVERVDMPRAQLRQANPVGRLRVFQHLRIAVGALVDTGQHQQTAGGFAVLAQGATPQLQCQLEQPFGIDVFGQAPVDLPHLVRQIGADQRRQLQPLQPRIGPRHQIEHRGIAVDGKALTLGIAGIEDVQHEGRHLGRLLRLQIGGMAQSRFTPQAHAQQAQQQRRGRYPAMVATQKARAAIDPTLALRGHRAMIQMALQIRCQCGNAGIAPCRLTLHGLQHDRVQITAQLSAHRSADAAGWQGRATSQDGRFQLAPAHRPRPATAERLIQQHADGIDVGGHADRLIEDLLGRGVRGRARLLLRAGQRWILAIQPLGNAKVEQPRLAAGIHQHVARLDVAMHHQLPMGVVDRLQQLDESPDAFAQAQWRQRLQQRLAIDMFHRQPRRAVLGHAHLQQPRDAGMVQPRQNRLLGLKAGAGLIAEEMTVQQLDRHAPAHTLPLRQIDAATAALPQQPFDLEGTQPRSQPSIGCLPSARGRTVVEKGISLPMRLQQPPQLADDRRIGFLLQSCVPQTSFQLNQLGEQRLGPGPLLGRHRGTGHRSTTDPRRADGTAARPAPSPTHA